MLPLTPNLQWTLEEVLKWAPSDVFGLWMWFLSRAEWCHPAIRDRMSYEQPQMRLLFLHTSTRLLTLQCCPKWTLRSLPTLLLVDFPWILPLIPIVLVKPLHFSHFPDWRCIIKLSTAPGSGSTLPTLFGLKGISLLFICNGFCSDFAQCGNAPWVNSTVLLQ